MKKTDAPVWLAGIAVLMFALGAMSEEEGLLVASLFAAGAAVVSYIAVLRSRLANREPASGLEARLEALERRLGITEGELDAANDQLRALRAERDFDRALASGRGSGGDSGSLLGHP